MGAAFTIMGVNPKQRCIAFTELQSKLNHFPYPLRHHQSPHVCAHILRGGTFLLSPAERFSEIKSDTMDLDIVPDAEELSPQEA